MKKYYILLFISLSFQFIYSQIVVLDEAPIGTGGIFNQFTVYDNDILYVKSTSSTYQPHVFLNYGMPNQSIDVNFNQSSQALFETQAAVINGKSLYGDDYNYKVGKNIFAIFPNFNGNPSSVRQLNKSRTQFNFNEFGFENIIKSGSNSLVEKIDILNESGSLINKRLRYLSGNNIRIIDLPTAFNDGNTGNYFTYNNALYFAGTLSNGIELHAENGFNSSNRITYSSINNPTGTGFRLPYIGNGGIWFGGNYKIYNGTSIENKGNELCFTNGDYTLGNIETAIWNGGPGDGTSGFLAYQTGIITNGTYNGSVPTVLGEINGNMIFYAENTFMRKIYAYPGNVDLGIPSFILNSGQSYVIKNNKLYLPLKLSGSSTVPRIYISNGTSIGLTIVDFPVYPNTSSYPVSANIFEAHGNIYFRANYFNSNETKSIIYKLNDINNTLTNLFEMPAIYTNSNLKPYQDGFIWHADNFWDANLPERLYGWNIEQRQIIINPNNVTKSNSKNQLANLIYKGETYPVDVVNYNPNVTDNLKIQILDETSNQQKFSITAPSPSNNQLFSNIFYAMNTFTDGNSHTSEISLGYHANMFPTIPNFNPANITCAIFENGVWRNETPMIDTGFNTFKIFGNFSDEVFIVPVYNNLLNTAETIFNHVKLYPNPANKTLHITSKNKETFTGYITDVNGRRIINFKHKNTVDVQNLTKGIYLVNIEKNGLKNVYRFIKN